jgi:general secretion pathway protein K
LKEAKLSTFLSQDQQSREGDPEVFLSGQVTDAQSRINLTQWVEASDGKGPPRLSAAVQLSLSRLFSVLGLPGQELDAMGTSLGDCDAGRAPSGAGHSAQSRRSFATPAQGNCNGWGLRPETAARLAPTPSILPEPTPLNLNTANAEVIYAAVPGVDFSSALKIRSKSRCFSFWQPVGCRQGFGRQKPRLKPIFSGIAVL